MTITTVEATNARRLTERIRLLAMTVTENIDKLKALVTQAKESEAHLALGYPSWTAYLSDVLGETPMRLEREVRQELVAELAAQGMSSRAIAPIVGAGHSTVDRDVAAATATAPNGAVAALAPGPVTGLNGKSYQRPVQTRQPEAEPEPPAAPRRRALTDAFFDAVFDAEKSVERLARLLDDDRFGANRAGLAESYGTHIDRLIDHLTTTLDRLNHA